MIKITKKMEKEAVIGALMGRSTAFVGTVHGGFTFEKSRLKNVNLHGIEGNMIGLALFCGRNDIPWCRWLYRARKSRERGVLILRGDIVKFYTAINKEWAKMEGNLKKRKK